MLLLQGESLCFSSKEERDDGEEFLLCSQGGITLNLGVDPLGFTHAAWKGFSLGSGLCAGEGLDVGLGWSPLCREGVPCAGGREEVGQPCCSVSHLPVSPLSTGLLPATAPAWTLALGRGTESEVTTSDAWCFLQLWMFLQSTLLCLESLACPGCQVLSLVSGV